MTVQYSKLRYNSIMNIEKNVIGDRKSFNLSLASIIVSAIFIISLIAATLSGFLKYPYCANNGFRSDQCLLEVLSVLPLTLFMSVPIVLTCMAIQHRKQYGNMTITIWISFFLMLSDLYLFIIVLTIPQ